MKTQPLSLTTDESLVIQRVRELKMAYWTDVAVPGAKDIYDGALESLMDAVELCMGNKKGGRK